MNAIGVLPVLFLTALVTSPAAVSQSFPLDASIDPTDPEMPVVFISTPNCTGQGVSLVHYDAYPIHVTMSGNYVFTVRSENGIASLYLHSDPFDPMAGFPSCIAGSNSGNPAGFIIPLTADTQYYLVPFNDAFDQTQTFDYRLESIGAGDVIFGFAPQTVFADGFEDLPPLAVSPEMDTMLPVSSGD